MKELLTDPRYNDPWHVLGFVGKMKLDKVLLHYKWSDLMKIVLDEDVTFPRAVEKLHATITRPGTTWEKERNLKNGVR